MPFLNALAQTPAVSAPDGGLFRTVLRRQGDDGVHTYRMPGLETSNAGTLLAVFDVRNDSSRILPANIDVGLMRSTDGGRRWSSMKRILDFDASMPGSRGNGVGDPSILVDRTTGRIWVAALWSFGNNGWGGSGHGFSPEETGQYVLTYSDDDGMTWSEPTSITPQVKKKEWRLLFQGPGKGLCLRDGTLIIPSQFISTGYQHGSCFIWSDDHGATWKLSPMQALNDGEYSNEIQMVELDSGRLLATMKNYSDMRKRCWNEYTWDKSTETLAEGIWGTARYNHNDPIVTASVLRGRSRLDHSPFSALLFANPNNPHRRQSMTARVSFDEGVSWSYERKIDDRPAGASCMALMPNGDIGLLYETGDQDYRETLTFARFPLTWITGVTDSDSDGIPDYFEETTGMSKNNAADAGEDIDGDGINNYEEFLTQTDPKVPSKFLLLKIKHGPEGMELEWPSVPYMKYSVFVSYDLFEWEKVPGLINLRANSNSMRKKLPHDAHSHAFYILQAHQ